MPHDINDRLIQVGDRVWVECVVDYVSPGDEFCNVGLKTVRPMFPTNLPTSIVLNTRQVEKGLRDAI